MRVAFILSCVLLASCNTSPHKEIDRDIDNIGSLEPGSIVHQTFEKLGNGFYQVKRSIVNSADHWEGIGHFSFIYFQDTKICQCNQFSAAISPDGKYIVYHSNESKKLELFNTDSKVVTGLSEKYVGYPNVVDWGFAENTALIKLASPDGSEENEITIQLK